MKIKPCYYRGCDGGELDTEMIGVYTTRYYVSCSGCKANGPEKPTKSEAIAAHNEISDAVHRKPKGNWLPEEEDDGVPYAY